MPIPTPSGDMRPLTVEERVRRATALTVAETAKPPRSNGAAAHEAAARLPALIWAGTPVDRWVKSENGLRRWRPIVDHLDILELPDSGRLIDFGGRQPPLRVEAELAAHLAWLLMPEEWRTALGDLPGARR